MSLTDLFSADSPPPDSPPPTPPRPRGEALFLDGASTPSHTPLKRRYGDFNDEDGPLSPSQEMEDFDLERAVTRAGNDGRSEVRLPDPNVEGIAPRAIAELFDDPLAMQDPLALGGSTEEAPKRSRVRAKVDADRLLGSRGLPALMSATRRFKVKGKGHEVRRGIAELTKTSDLSRLMDTYQIWAHGMFPRGEFAFTIERTEKVCRSVRMVNAIKGLRDEFHPPPRSPTPDPEDGENNIGGGGGQESLGAFIEGEEESLGDESFRYAPGPETLAADRRPLFAPGPDVDVDVDEDELAAMAEMERETGESLAVETRRETRVDFGDEPPAFDEEEEW
ncbi:hypothetical protein CcaverHIS002_0607740 [Cutaneotrichosporon cavernicola]|uniref:Chromosome segregation in meiosis protein n=1 Tax=Cutaneotrichosporon cavernicola TaxID=279322 RepID=A0AA48QYF8_9TREE|nr:uncharacterized protein CcaverHIS019_0607190 [Cutaneotrichosporon cavernicola]BEI86487.1 hypothetical protein CcaverHIS002_0607740 [Cutaneotrichosporon cavernicola]BEI94260.1 hypothetical protein CcaverHIS019_0607190 [Cutaneotrichosporon cavernicola]BEJ02038.1 hypothetical protein CcaverHIS631_0607200 [Cutaneotrichosporon cavernicola]BEJ09799.1 hypothetical protein CcaverHIS641_0607140 [Cutaneotrichosporon cavernicola]